MRRTVARNSIPPRPCSLLEAHRLTGDTRYLDSAERGFSHYKRDYYDRGRLDPHLLVFFANWQSQAGRPVLRRTWSVSTATSVLPALASTRTNSWHTWVRLSRGPREVSADRLPLRERTCH